MLPRNLRRVVLTRTTPAHIRAALTAQSSLRSSSLRFRPVLSSPTAFHPSVTPSSISLFHSSSRRQNELPKSPFQTFVEVLKEELKKNRELQDNVKQLSGIKENPRLRAAAEELRKTGVKVGDAVGEALKSMEEMRSMLGFEEKEARRQRRQLRLAKAGKESIARGVTRVKANPEAGQAMVLHKDSPRQEKWARLKETNPVFQTFASLRQSYDESEHPVVMSVRSVTQTIGSWFDENESAQVQRMMKAMDPTFNMEAFERDLREYIVPEVVDAYLSADQEALKLWCGEATYNVLWATMEQYLKQGLISDSKVLDIRQVEISSGKILENNIPVFVITFATQEMLLFRNAKTKEIMVGAEDRVEQCHYAAVVTRVEEDLDNELTGGWKVVEMARRSARAYL
ncbi:hypothetical protein NLI96_g8835 [Meripilus lineatus]|uniref:Mitochondrial import inner membrane translocase subunit TIM44 n=1 Tax=Meripilus lineatus TaxID=2056292 RepID=A0AAD5YFU8_9APHY|nr:hypothetical protein NLI96_g8835 [Physisporinus lineatus]